MSLATHLVAGFRYNEVQWWSSFQRQAEIRGHSIAQGVLYESLCRGWFFSRKIKKILKHYEQFLFNLSYNFYNSEKNLLIILHDLDFYSNNRIWYYLPKIVFFSEIFELLQMASDLQFLVLYISPVLIFPYMLFLGIFELYMGLKCQNCFKQFLVFRFQDIETYRTYYSSDCEFRFFSHFAQNFLNRYRLAIGIVLVVIGVLVLVEYSMWRSTNISSIFYSYRFFPRCKFLTTFLLPNFLLIWKVQAIRSRMRKKMLLLFDMEFYGFESLEFRNSLFHSQNVFLCQFDFWIQIKQLVFGFSFSFSM